MRPSKDSYRAYPRDPHPSSTHREQSGFPGTAK